MLRAAAIGAVIVFAAVAPVHAAAIDIPNHSFEEPGPAPGLEFLGVNFVINDWNEDAYTLDDEGEIIDLGVFPPLGVGLDTGVFVNPAFGSPGHLLNTDGDQGGFLFARNSRWIRQTLAATWQEGTYDLTIAVATSSQQPVAADSKLQIALYYDDDGDENTETINIIATMFVSGDDVADYSPTFSSPAFVDFLLAGVMPPPQALGYAIGILIRPEQISTEADEARTGVWDIDNVRLNVQVAAVPAPSAAASVIALAALAATRRRR